MRRGTETLLACHETEQQTLAQLWKATHNQPQCRVSTSLVSKRMPSGQALKMLLLTRGWTRSSSLSNNPRRRGTVGSITAYNTQYAVEPGEHSLGS